MQFLFSLLRIKGIYTFRALLVHPQEALNKRHLVYYVRLMSVGCTWIEVELQYWCYVNPGVMSVLVLCQSWCYVNPSIMSILVLCQLVSLGLKWKSNTGVMSILVLCQSWCYVNPGVMSVLVLCQS
jgi:hypothetical protein